MGNLIYKLTWLLWLVLILFFRDSIIEKSIIVLIAIILSVIAVRRAINARNDWRPIAEEYHKDLEK
tara:strand:+ start:182 stop:379 length:198 start_codon:yes stop_codon:yes gene_type:complete